MKTPDEFVKEYYQLPQSKIETVRIKSLIRCLERYSEYLKCEVNSLNEATIERSKLISFAWYILNRQRYYESTEKSVDEYLKEINAAKRN
jgi:DNA integrity scanning protein DisA with diadenylate cyclase activity